MVCSPRHHRSPLARAIRRAIFARTDLGRHDLEHSRLGPVALEQEREAHCVSRRRRSSLFFFFGGLNRLCKANGSGQVEGCTIQCGLGEIRIDRALPLTGGAHVFCFEGGSSSVSSLSPLSLSLTMGSLHLANPSPNTFLPRHLGTKRSCTPSSSTHASRQHL